MRARVSMLLVAALLMLIVGSSPAEAAQPERQDIMTQDGSGVYAADGARLVRQPNGIAVSVSMPSPAPGTYVYPDGIDAGSPEVFTLWAFVFNHPEECTAPCGPDDTGNPAVGFGVYNIAGHVNSGKKLTLSGHAKVGQPAMAPPGVTPHPLSNPSGAEVHVAVTSHGGLDPATLPGEFRSPTGSPVCGCWWVALFL